MLELHLPTALLYGMLISLAVALITVALAVRDRSDYMIAWAGGAAMAALGLMLASLRGVLPLWLSVVGGNLVIVGSQVLTVAGIYWYRQMPAPWKRLGMVLVLTVVAFVGLTFGVDDHRQYLGVRIAALSLLLTTLGLWALWVLWGLYRWGDRSLVAFALFAFALFTFAVALRGIVGWRLTGELPAVHGPAVLFTMLSGLSLLLQGLAMIGLHTERLTDRLDRLAHTDQLTQLNNRRHFEQQAARLVERAQRSQLPLSLVVMDADHFKRINDELGHEAGDMALQAVSEHLRKHVRPGDLCARLGGEEFVLMLAGAPLEVAAARGQAMLQGAVRYWPHGPGSAPRELTLSAGLAVLHPQDTHLAALVRRADAALYQAKAQGRHRLCVAPDPVAPNASLTPAPGQTT